MARVYYLGGRMFSPTETLTARQDGWLMVQLSDTGLFDVLGKGLGTKDEQAIARELIVEAHRSGKYFHIIAGRVVEDEKKWTPKDAEANAEWFADLSTPDDKAQLTTAFVEVLSGFFTSAGASLVGSPTVSPTSNDALGTPNSDGVTSTSSPSDTAGPTAPESSPMAIATA
jgi:hypothetical protein